MPCIHHYSVIRNSFTISFIRLKNTLCSTHLSLPPFPLIPDKHDPFIVSIVLPFPECPIVGISQYLTFSNWLLSLINTLLGFLHVCSWLDSLFLFSGEYYSTGWLCHSLFVEEDVFQVMIIFQQWDNFFCVCVCVGGGSVSCESEGN